MIFIYKNISLLVLGLVNFDRVDDPIVALRLIDRRPEQISFLIDR